MSVILQLHTQLRSLRSTFEASEPQVAGSALEATTHSRTPRLVSVCTFIFRLQQQDLERSVPKIKWKTNTNHCKDDETKPWQNISQWVNEWVHESLSGPPGGHSDERGAAGLSNTVAAARSHGPHQHGPAEVSLSLSLSSKHAINLSVSVCVSLSSLSC